MSKEINNKSSEEIFAEPIPHVEKLTTGINRITSGDSSVNSYALRNSIINAKKKAAICQKNGNSLPPSAVAMQAQGQRMQASLTVQRSAAASPKPRGKNLYKKGYTVTGASFTALETEAALDIDHSAKLGRNISVANPSMVRPPETDAHHIVAREDFRAELSRIYIFTVGIGVNDADNGGIMPRFKMTFIPSMPNSSKHQEIHTSKYHAAVYAELLYASEHTEQATRLTLRSIKGQVLAGTFPF